MKLSHRIFKVVLCLSLLFSSMALAASKGEQAPNLFGRTLEGDLFRLNSVTGPKVVNFFWVECAPCRKELPELQILEQKYPEVKFIAVHLNAGDEESETVRAFIKGLDGSPKTVVLSSMMVQETFKFSAFPYTVVIDKNNKVIARFKTYSGAESIAELEKAIKRL